MRVLVCVKRVPAPGAKINITADGQAVEFEIGPGRRGDEALNVCPV